MDEIEMLIYRVTPVDLGIFDVEFAIGREPAGLNGTEICANHDGAGMLVRNINCPNSGAGADVKYSGSSYWGEIQRSVQD